MASLNLSSFVSPSSSDVKAVLYLRVSTKDQTTETQRVQLEAIAQSKGWAIQRIYADEGISGFKGRDDRPAFDAMLNDAVANKFDIVMAWAIDRLGRSLIHLSDTIAILEKSKIDLYLHQQQIDTSTPAGKLVFHVMGAIAEFERNLIRERVIAGVERAQKEGKHCGRPFTPPERVAEIRGCLERGMGIRATARACKASHSVVQRVRAEYLQEQSCSPAGL